MQILTVALWSRIRRCLKPGQRRRMLHGRTEPSGHWHAFVLIGAGLLAGSTAARAGAWQSLDAIEQAAKSFVSARLSTTGSRRVVEPKALDSRLRLAPCESALEAFLPRGGKLGVSATVGVRCRAPKPWKVFVPVRVVVHARILVTVRPLARNAAVGEADVTIAERDVTGLPFGYYTELNSLAGQRLTRPVAQGMVLTPSMLEAQNLIRRGQRVKLVANTGGIEVSMAGKALMDGADGTRIRVENLSSGQEVEGVVRSGETVEILLN